MHLVRVFRIPRFVARFLLAQILQGASVEGPGRKIESSILSLDLTSIPLSIPCHIGVHLEEDPTSSEGTRVTVRYYYDL